MKTFVLSKSSWHYKLVSRMTTYGRHRSERDICEYVQCLLGSILIISIIVTLATFLSIPFIHMFIGIGFSIWMGAWFFTELGTMGLLITGVVGGALLIRKILSVVEKWLYNRSKVRLYGEPKPDGFVKSAYKSWKGKYCLKIEFAEDKHDDNIRAGQE